MKRYWIFVLVAAVLSSCSSTKYSTNEAYEPSGQQKAKTEYREVSSTLAVEVEKDAEPPRSNTAVVHVVPCDQIASNTEESQPASSAQITQKLKLDTSTALKMNEFKNFFPSPGVSKRLPLMKRSAKFNSIRQLKKLKRKTSHPGSKKGLDSLVYLILVILLILLILRLLSVLVGPIFDVLLLVLLIFVIGRILGFW